jgi:hypothetical protein
MLHVGRGTERYRVLPSITWLACGRGRIRTCLAPELRFLTLILAVLKQPPGNVLEMQNLGLHPRFTEAETGVPAGD